MIRTTTTIHESEYPAGMCLTELAIIDMIVQDALTAGYKIQVAGDGEVDVDATDDYSRITAGIGMCDTTQLVMTHPDGKPAIWVALAHGNGFDVIADYTDNPSAIVLLERAEALAREFEAKQGDAA